jgi:putative addiction module component (TIGR02574 family)
MRATDIPNFQELTDQERLALAEDILSTLQHPEALPDPVAHRVELDRRWAAYQANRAIALTKEQFRAQVAALRR